MSTAEVTLQKNDIFIKLFILAFIALKNSIWIDEVNFCVILQRQLIHESSFADVASAWNLTTGVQLPHVILQHQGRFKTFIGTNRALEHLWMDVTFDVIE